jgi:rhodanese-related sulfurtransferase
MLYLSGQLGQKPPAVARSAADRCAEAYDLYQQDVFLLDVRTQEEWDSQHVPGATLIPLDQLESRLDELPQDQEIVVMCRSGNRSQTGQDILLNAGFETSPAFRAGSLTGRRRDFQPFLKD